jgi:periplasmic protein TonB
MKTILFFLFFFSIAVYSQDNQPTGAPKIIKSVAPVYPAEALKQKLEGKVIVAVTVNEEGNVLKANILRSSNKIFNNAALEAAKKTKFAPFNVTITIPLPFNFTLKKEK